MAPELVQATCNKYTWSGHPAFSFNLENFSFGLDPCRQGPVYIPEVGETLITGRSMVGVVIRCLESSISQRMSSPSARMERFSLRFIPGH